MILFPRSPALWRTAPAMVLIASFACGPRAPAPASEKPPSTTAREQAPGSRVTRDCIAPASVKLSMKLIGQEESYWCWAASAQMAMDLFGARVLQCEQANDLFGLGACCNPSRPFACDNTGWPQFARYGFGATKTTTDTPLTWNQLVEEIGCHKRPVAFSWKLSGGSGHMMVAYGYQVNAQGVPEVLVNDPVPLGKGERLQISYDAYVSADSYTHWKDFYNIAR